MTDFTSSIKSIILQTLHSIKKTDKADQNSKTKTSQLSSNLKSSPLMKSDENELVEFDETPAYASSSDTKKTGGGSKDGEINDTKQGSTGDCWLMSGINALSYTDEGKKVIKDAIDYNNDGSTTVHLKGFGDVQITSAELQEAKNSDKFSKGDDDMLILELAIRKVLDQLKANGSKLDNAPPEVQKALQATINADSEETITGGFPIVAMYLLTGEYAQSETVSDAGSKADVDTILKEFENNNNKDMALTACFDSDMSINDVSGIAVDIVGNHAYAVKEVKSGVVTLTNPWDSSKEINVSADTLKASGCRVDYVKV